MLRQLTIDSYCIADDRDCYVVAEIGHNHQGSVETAKRLIKSAKECGANAVKFQKRDNRHLYTNSMYNSPYENENSYGATYGEHREKLEFGFEEYKELQSYASELGISFFATAFDFPSADFLMKLGVPAIKIASGDLHNIPLLKYVASMKIPMIVSTGGGSLEDVQRAYDQIISLNSKVSFMQCTASYPVEPEDMNLRVIASYRERFPDLVIGLSDHQNGIALALVGYILGARIIEKHFTLNRAWKGTDHSFSLEPIGLRKLVRDLRRAQLALGDAIKKPLPCEEAALRKMGKKLVAARNLPADHRLTVEDIAMKSPGDGLPPYEMDNVLGKITVRAIKEDENISFDLLRDGT